MSDIEETPNNLKKLWLNPYGIKLPTVSGISMGNISSIKDFTDYESYRFVNLKYANLEEKKIVVNYFRKNWSDTPHIAKMIKDYAFDNYWTTIS